MDSGIVSLVKKLLFFDSSKFVLNLSVLLFFIILLLEFIPSIFSFIISESVILSLKGPTLGKS